MIRKSISGFLFLLALCFSCKKESKVTPSGLDWEAISNKMMERIDLQSGERVLFIAQPGRFDTLLHLLQSKIINKKGEFLGAISIDSVQPPSWETDFTKKSLALDSASLIQHFSTVDLGIMMPGAFPMHKPYAALQEVLKKGTGRTIHFHWIGAYDNKGNPIPVTDSIDLFYQKALLETDYASLARLQKKFELSAQGKTIEVSTPEGTSLRFQITGRPVTKQDGDASLARSKSGVTLIDREVELPAGAIRVAPLEETVEGTIAFPPSLWNQQPVTGLMLTFYQGKITAVEATTGKEAVEAELQKGGEAARSFRELAMGFNPTLLPAGGHTWIPYFGYGAGIVRLSLGDNSELNGNVRGNYVRWNFFTNATLKVGDDVWVKDGYLIMKE